MVVQSKGWLSFGIIGIIELFEQLNARPGPTLLSTVSLGMKRNALTP